MGLNWARDSVADVKSPGSAQEAAVELDWCWQWQIEDCAITAGVGLGFRGVEGWAASVQSPGTRTEPSRKLWFLTKWT